MILLDLTKQELQEFFVQNLDAKIALNVVWNFAKKGIPCLPVHDSFIVAKQYKEELKTIMQHSYRMMFAADIIVH